MTLVAGGFLEELQDHVADNSGLGFVSGTNFTIGQSPDPIQDFPTLLTATRMRLTIYESSGTLARFSRRIHQERTLRFLHRGDFPQDAINRAWNLVEWFENESLHASLTSFTYRLLRTATLPTIVASSEDGSALADHNMTLLVFNKV